MIIGQNKDKMKLNSEAFTIIPNQAWWDIVDKIFKECIKEYKPLPEFPGVPFGIKPVFSSSGEDRVIRYTIGRNMKTLYSKRKTITAEQFAKDNGWEVVKYTIGDPNYENFDYSECSRIDESIYELTGFNMYESPDDIFYMEKEAEPKKFKDLVKACKRFKVLDIWLIPTVAKVETSVATGDYSLKLIRRSKYQLLKTVKLIKDTLNISLADAKELVDNAPSMLLTNVSKVEALSFYNALVDLDNDVEIVGSDFDPKTWVPKAGDKITITKSDVNWNEDMDLFVGKTYTVEKVNIREGLTRAFFTATEEDKEGDEIQSSDFAWMLEQRHYKKADKFVITSMGLLNTQNNTIVTEESLSFMEEEDLQEIRILLECA